MTTPGSTSSLQPQKPNDIQHGGSHYKTLVIQPWDYITLNGIPYLEGCAIKYLTRWREKGGILDLQKARHFIDKLIELEEKRIENTELGKVLEEARTNYDELSKPIELSRGLVEENFKLFEKFLKEDYKGDLAKLWNDYALSTGLLNRAGILHIMTDANMFSPLTRVSVANLIIKTLDKNNDGCLNWEEFRTEYSRLVYHEFHNS